VGSRRPSRSRTPEASLSAQLKLEALEIETRLRKHILELMEPATLRTQKMEARLKEMGSSLQFLGEEVKKTRSQLEGTETLRSVVDTFRTQLTEADLGRAVFEQRLGDRLSGVESDISALRSANEQKAAREKTFERNLRSMGDLVSGSQEELAGLQTYCRERLDHGRDKLAKLRDEFESKSMLMDGLAQRLEDEQTEARMELTHVKESLRQVGRDTSEAVKMGEDLQRSKASIVVVEEQQQENAEFTRQMTAQVGALKQQFGSLIDDVKAHFHTALEAVGTSTARQMEDMRAKYQDEARSINRVTADIDAFLEEQRGAQTALKDEVAEARKDARSSIARVHEQVKEQLRSAEHITSNLAIEAQQMKTTLTEVASQGRAQGAARTAESAVTSLLVECLLVSSALDWQDDQDRKSVALYGYKAGDNRPPPGVQRPWTLPDIEGAARATGKLTPRGKLKESSGMSTPRTGVTPVMTIDNRCLSCSGSAATVLAGFKLACLEYAASPVEYQKATYSRAELIRLQMDLLRQAKEQLRDSD
jgi:hypothetical protein